MRRQNQQAHAQRADKGRRRYADGTAACRQQGNHAQCRTARSADQAGVGERVLKQGLQRRTRSGQTRADQKRGVDARQADLADGFVHGKR